jgi:hypothetical protein
VPGFGRRPSTDVRNVAHLMHRRLAPIEAANPIIQKTWGFKGVALDQGNTGTCTGHAGAHFIHCSPISHRGFLDPFALYREAVLLDEYDDNDDDATKITNAGLQAGSSGTGVAKALSRRELITEYLWAQRFEDAITWVLTRGPVMVGSNWYSSMMNVSPAGHLVISPGAGIVGGHEWLIRGANKKRGLALVVNSWGPAWGGVGRWESAKVRPGHALIDFATLARLFHEDGDAVSAIEA